MFSSAWGVLGSDTVTGEDAWEALSTVVLVTDTTLRIALTTLGSTSGDVTYYDKISLKLLHDYNTTTNSVISIGGVESEALGSEIATNGGFASWSGGYPVGFNHSTDTANSEIEEVGSAEGHGGAGTGACNIWTDNNTATYISITGLTIDTYYTLTFDITNSVAGTIKGGTTNVRSEIFNGISAVDSYEYTFECLDNTDLWIIRSASATDITIDNVSIKEVIPILAKPVRIDSITDGVCTLLNADFSDLGSAITSGFATSATLTRYTEGAGWKAGLDLDHTPINENSEFSDWEFGSELVTGTDSDMSGANNWDDSYATKAIGSGKMTMTGTGEHMIF